MLGFSRLQLVSVRLVCAEVNVLGFSLNLGEQITLFLCAEVYALGLSLNLGNRVIIFLFRLQLVCNPWLRILHCSFLEPKVRRFICFDKFASLATC